MPYVYSKLLRRALSSAYKQSANTRYAATVEAVHAAVSARSPYGIECLRYHAKLTASIKPITHTLTYKWIERVMMLRKDIVYTLSCNSKHYCFNPGSFFVRKLFPAQFTVRKYI